MHCNGCLAGLASSCYQSGRGLSRSVVSHQNWRLLPIDWSQLFALDWSKRTRTHQKKQSRLLAFAKRGRVHRIMGVSWRLEVCPLIGKGEEENDICFRDSRSRDTCDLGFCGTWLSPSRCGLLDWKAWYAISNLCDTERGWIEGFSSFHISSHAWFGLRAVWDAWREEPGGVSEESNSDGTNCSIDSAIRLPCVGLL